MENVLNSWLYLLSKAVGCIALLMVTVSMGTMSGLGIYEPEMPDVLKPEDEGAD